MRIRLQRVYDRSPVNPGKRVLVDRIWPRGIKKEELHLNLWLRELAPSTALRKWFGHDPKRWEEFQRRYRAELRQREQQARLHELLTLAQQGPVTLLYSAKDEEHNQAVALRQVVEDSLRSGRST
jgi:uncharacterized protein YeaO (DUF488 family)